MTQIEINTLQRKRRAANGNLDTRRYEKTPRGILMRKYRNMLSRVTGIQKQKAHLYKGLSILPKEEFYTWAWDQPEFWRLYGRWKEANYKRSLCPTVNRIDPKRGYELDNMEWITHGVNSALASHNRFLMEKLHAIATS